MHKIIINTLAITCLLATGCKEKSTNNSQPHDQQRDSVIQTVEVINPSTRDFSADIVITGSVEPELMVIVHSMENGYLKSVKVDIGDKVKRGQTLAVLDNPELRYAFQKAQAKITEINANVNVIKTKIKAAKSESVLKKNKYERLKTLNSNSTGLTTLTELENAQGEFEMASSMIDLLNAKLASENAVLKSEELALKLNLERQSYLTIKAPFSGIVTKRYVDAGTLIQSGLSDKDAMPIVNIEMLEKVRVIIPLPESDITGLDVGTSTDVEFPYLAGASYKGKISRIGRSLDSSSKTMEVQIDLDNKDLKIKPGMYAKVKIQRKSQKEILSLPHTAVFMKKDAPFVFVVNDNVVQEIALKKGMSGKDNFEVLNANISANSMVVLKGKNLIKNGQSVKAIKK